MTRGLLPSRFEIASFWATKENDPPHVFGVDLGLPSCFACGYFSRELDRELTDARRWNKSALQRAHIVAASAGGSEQPSNLVLLCKSCHADAPMVQDPHAMFEWCGRREQYWPARVRKVSDDLLRRGYTLEDLASVTPAELGAAMDSLDVGLHMGDFGPQIPAASVAEAYVVALRKKRVAAT